MIPTTTGAKSLPLVSFLQHVPIWLILFVLFMAHNWGVDISGGEAQYLSYAKQYMDPEWIPNSFTFTEEPGARIVFQALIGFFARYLDFPLLIGLLRAINFLAYALVLGRILTLLRIPGWLTFILFEIYLVATQSFFGAEWFFISFEPKTIAYACCFAGLYTWLQGNWRSTTWWLILATYFHFLVGGWFMLTLAVVSALDKEWKKSLLRMFWYVLGILPLLVYILSMLHHLSPESEGARADWIYAYYRLPHHLGIFQSTEYFMQTHMAGITWIFFWWIIIYWQRHQWQDSRSWRLLRQVHTVMGVFILAFVLVAWIDSAFLHQSGGLLLKSYPFRQNVFFKLFTLLLIGYWMWQFLESKLWMKRAIWLCIPLLALFFIQTNKNILRNKNFWNREAYFQTTQWIRQNTPKQTVCIPYGIPENERITLGMLSERDPWVEWKFVPAGTNKIYEWYRRQQVLDTFQITGDPLPVCRAAHSPSIVVSTTGTAPDSTSLRRLYRNDTYTLWACESHNRDTKVPENQ